MPHRPDAVSTRYQHLALELEQQIAGGVLRPGDRLPSVRQACSSRGLSASTVFQAYYLLESRGLVRRRPSETDRRVKVLQLTPNGIRLRTLLLDRMTAPPAALERLSPREQRELVRILSRLLE